MFHSRVHIAAGDLVIIYISRDNTTSVTVTPGEVFHNKYGRYLHDDMIGVKYGSKLHSPPPHSGYVHLLRPTPELWTLSLPHRTQILYLPDISYILMRLGIRTGGKVIEAGTGSGSMTHALARSVGLGGKGQVCSFEYHRKRYETALEEFESHGLTNVHLEHRNVCKDGFGDVTGVEAVFLDLPAPWEAIPHAMTTLRDDTITRICCFSPCLEQVLKTVSTLRAEGWSDIFTQEVLTRTHELVPPPLPSSSHLHDISGIVERLKAHERRKEERRVVQMRYARERAAKLKEEAAAAAGGDKAEGARPDVAASGETEAKGRTPEEEREVKRKLEAGAEDFEKQQPKRPRTDGGETKEDGVPDAQSVAVVEPENESAPVAEIVEGGTARPASDPTGEASTTETVRPLWTEPTTTIHSQILTKPSPEMRGHTSYFTFAVLHPAHIRRQTMPHPPVETAEAVVTTTRVAELVKEAGAGAARQGSEETEYGDEVVEQAMGTMTEEEMVALTGGPVTE